MGKRYALLGWLMWKVGKRVARRRAKSAVPRIDRESKRPNVAAIASAVAAVAAAAWFWRRREGDEMEASE